MKYTKYLSLGYDEQGKRIRKKIQADTKAELNRKVGDAYRTAEVAQNPSEIDFGTFCAEWLRTYKANNEKATRAMYENAVNKLKDLYPLAISAIKKSDLQRILNENADKQRTCQILALTMRQICQTAVDEELMPGNPAARLSLPKYVKAEKRALTAQETLAFKEAQYSSESNKAVVLILFYFGLRPGELLALKSTDFDFEHHTLTVSRAIAFEVNTPYEKGTKTDNTRTLPIPVAVEPELKRYVEAKEGYLFCGAGAKMPTKAYWRRKWESICKDVGIDYLTPYIFRHTYCTNCFYSGVSVKMTSRLMGHASTNMVMKVYAHLNEEKEDLSGVQNMVM